MVLLGLAGDTSILAIVHYFLGAFFTIFTVAIFHDQLDTAVHGVTEIQRLKGVEGRIKLDS